MQTVGVAPGTITIQPGACPQQLFGGSAACPPDPPWQYFTPPFARPAPSSAAGTQITTVDYDPYGTDSKLEGFGLTVNLPKVDPQKTRWDIALMVGGGALIVAMTLGILATR